MAKKPQEIRLLAMRLADLVWVHPKMDRSHVCTKCGAPVGLYPSGQAVLKRYKDVEIVCHICVPLTPTYAPAPGWVDELFQSVPREP